MKKIKAKKSKETTRDRHLKWINYYGSKNFGIWIECTECKKWRRTFQYTESHEVPEDWNCSMLNLENGEKGNCNEPEENNDEQYLEYSPGSVVWAKLEGYPWWPGMVDGDPNTDEYLLKEGNTIHYNVTFLDEKPTHAWIPEMFICPFFKMPKARNGSLQRIRQKRYTKTISKANERAEAAMEMTIKDRLQMYSFVYLYKGRWSAACNLGLISEECDMEENESREVEDMAKVLLKQSNKVKPVCFDDTDDKRKKNVFHEKDLASFERKTPKTKYLNTEDLPDSKQAFLSQKKKHSINSSSYHSQNLVEGAENCKIPYQDKRVKELKRKLNVNCTSRKKKNFENIIISLNNDFINLGNTDSEHKSIETLSTVIVPKEKSSEIIHVSEEKSIADVNENSLFEEPKCENLKAWDKKSNVSTLTEMVIDEKTIISSEKGIHLSPKDEILKHEDISVGKAIENMKKFDECDLLEQNNNIKTTKELSKETIETSRILKNESMMKNKSQNMKNSQKSNIKVEIVKENITNFSLEFQNTKAMQNENKSVSKTTNQVILKTTNLTKESLLNINPVDININTLSKKELKTPFFLNNSTEETDENVVDKNEFKQKNVVKMSNELSIKSQNTKRSNNKIENLKESITIILPEYHESKALQNKNKSISNATKQAIVKTTNLTKKSQKNIKPVDDNLSKLLKKQPKPSVNDSAKDSDEIVVGKDSIIHYMHDEKILKPIPSKKITILL